MRNTFLVVVGVAAAAAAVAGCSDKGEKAGRQKAAVEARKTAIETEVDGILQKWLDEMVGKLPADVKKYPKAKSPLVRWRLDSFGFDWRRPVGAAIVKAKGTPFEKHFEGISEFFDAMEQFWGKKIDFKDYMAAWDVLKGTARSKLINLLADFDHTFVHVEAFYGAQDMDGDDRAIYFFRHWQVAFRFPREYNEAVSQYLERLCKAKMKDYCSTVPFEKLHFAMERPYLTEVKRIVGEFLKAYPDCKLNRIYEPFLAEVDGRMKNLPTFTEDPVMPGSLSKKDYVGDVVLTVRKSGLEYEDRTMVTLKPETPWVLPAAGELAKAGAAIAKLSDSLEKERGPENMEVIRLDMDREAPMSIAAWVTSTWSKLPARFLTFGARRRVDGIDKGTVIGRLQFRDVPIGRRTRDLDGARLQCQDIGQTTDAADLASKVKTAVFVDGDKLLAGEVSGDKVTGLKPVDAAEAAKRLLASDSLLAVRDGVTVERFLSVLEPAVVKCKDQPQCSIMEDLTSRIRVEVCSGR